MLTYQVLGPNEQGMFTVAYIIPDAGMDAPYHGRYSAMGMGRTYEQAFEECRRLNEPPCERRIALREKANRIVTDIPQSEKDRRGIK